KSKVIKLLNDISTEIQNQRNNPGVGQPTRASGPCVERQRMFVLSLHPFHGNQRGQQQGELPFFQRVTIEGMQNPEARSIYANMQSLSKQFFQNQCSVR